MSDNLTTTTDPAVDVDEVTVLDPDEQTDEATEQDPPADDEQDPETFPREYVENLRREAADARVKAKKADGYAERLHAALVTATGRLADPTDLPFDEAHLDDDGDALAAALDELLARKPHLAARTPRGDIGQGAGTGPETVDLAAILRGRA